MPEMICVWPDGMWCYRNELEDYINWKSDDYYEIAADSEEAKALMDE